MAGEGSSIRRAGSTCVLLPEESIREIRKIFQRGIMGGY